VFAVKTYNGHAAEESIKDSHPCRAHDRFDRTDVTLGDLPVHGSKRESGGNHRNEKKESYGDRLLIEVGHLAAPVGSNGGLDVVDDATAPHVRLFKRDLSRAFN
jgi:hypothetical protein